MNQEKLQARLTELAAKHHVVGASLAARRRRPDGDRRGRRAERAHRRPRHRRQRVPDRQHHQGLDRDAGDAARRRGPGRPRRSAHRLPARLPGARRADHVGGHRPPSPRPHQRYRRGLLPRHRPRRRLRRPLRRRDVRPRRQSPARRDDELCQLRLRGARPAGRGRDQGSPGTRCCASACSRRSASMRPAPSRRKRCCGARPPGTSGPRSPRSGDCRAPSDPRA